MTERPILFSAPMVRALLDGSKTQTRRVCKNQPYPNGYKLDGNDFLCHNDYLPPSAMLMDGGGKHLYTTSDLEGWTTECPYGQPGEQLWVRESWRVARQHDKTKPVDLPYDKGLTTFYEAGGSRARQEVGGPYVNDDEYPYPCLPDWVGKGRPSIHMPRVASRIQLEVVSVRVERLNECSPADAIAEGIRRIGEGFERWHPDPADTEYTGTTRDPVLSYRGLWESINGAGSWAANPWVWVIEFRRIKP